AGRFRMISACRQQEKRKQTKIRNMHDGHHRSRNRGFVLRPFFRLHQSLRQSLSVRAAKMLLDYVLGGGVTLFLLAYLTYALARPERF
ncbi:potassium-transporting ATPase subunit F, partial [Mesorhizobium sp.]|uniref:potassium-transporting ATPase subunit F n=1 Tax=Mesorhizobium sp. TaxID=1871066 RepID=UPI0025EC5D06